MTSRQRKDVKLFKDISNSDFIIIITGILYLMVFVTGEPVCFTETSLDEGYGMSRYVKRVDCDGTDKICWRFASKEDVKMGDLLNSPCTYIEDDAVTVGSKAPTCLKDDLPNVTNGHFNCSGFSVGDKCNLTCDGGGYFPLSAKNTSCERFDDHKTGWRIGNFQCSHCNEWFQWNGNEYAFIRTLKTWGAFRNLCESKNSHLATIQTKEENEFVRKITRLCLSHWDAWIGLNRKEGRWEWIDGTVSPYRNWGEYDQQSYGGSEYNCVYIYGATGKWFNWARCHDGRFGVCERNISL